MEIKNKSYFLKLQKSSNSYTDRQTDRQTDRPSGTQGGSSSYYIVHTYNRAVVRSENMGIPIDHLICNHLSI